MKLKLFALFACFMLALLPSISYAQCTDCVLLTSNQTIDGEKSFIAPITAQSGIVVTGLQAYGYYGIIIDVITGDGVAIAVNAGGGDGNITGVQADASGAGVGGEFSGGNLGGTGVIAYATGGNGSGLIATGNGSGSGIKVTNGNGGTAIAVSNVSRTARFTSSTSANTATSTIGAFTFQALAALHPTDQIATFNNSLGVNLFTIDQTGAVLSSSSATKGTVVLSGGSASVTVRAGVKCVCSLEIGNTPPKCPVSGTTMNITGDGSETHSYICM